MTEDEINKMNAIRGIENEYEKSARLRVVEEVKASKAGEESELKPCPLCGYDNPRLIDAEEISHRKFSVYVQCGNLGCSYVTALREDSREAKEKWNNAWAHKQIVALQSELETEKRKNADLEKYKEFLTRQNSQWRDQIAELEKRNAKLEKITQHWVSIETFHKLRLELKTAEDALASEKNKSDSQQRILDRITGKKERP